MIQTFEHLWVLNFDPLKTKTLVKFRDVMIILNQFLNFESFPLLCFTVFFSLWVGAGGGGGIKYRAFIAFCHEIPKIFKQKIILTYSSLNFSLISQKSRRKNFNSIFFVFYF